MKKEPVQIEKTAKRYKGGKVAGVLLALTGLGFAFAGKSTLAVPIGIFGVLLFIFAKFLGWWHRG